MVARTLIWTGAAGDNIFATAANWQNAQTHRAPKVGPHLGDTIDLVGTSTITGNGTVTALDVAQNAVFELMNANITAATLTDTGDLALQAAQLHSKSITIGSTTNAATLTLNSLYGPSTLAALGPSLDITVGGGAGSSLLVGVFPGNNSTLALGSGTLAVGTASGAGDLFGTFATISAAMLDIGNGATGLVELNYSQLSLGTANGVGLVVGAAPGQMGAQVATLAATNSTITVKGTAEIGTQGTGGVTIYNYSTLKTLDGVTLGGTGFNDGDLGIYGTWHDTGNVFLNNGSQLALAFATGVAKITGNIIAQTGQRFSPSISATDTAALNVSGTVSLQTYGGMALQFQNDATLTCGALTLQDSGGQPFQPGIADFQTGAILTTGDLALTGTFDFQSTGATLTVSRSLNIGAGGTLTTGFTRIGNYPKQTAATIAGTLAVTTATTTIIGAVDLVAGVLDVTTALSISARTTGLVSNGGTTNISGSDSASALFVSSGGIALLADSSMAITEGNVTATAIAGQPALTIDATSRLNFASGTLTLDGGANIAGELMSTGVLDETGAINIAATGALTVSSPTFNETISGPVDNLGRVTANSTDLTFLGTVSGTGTFAIGVSGALTFMGTAAAGVAVDFSPLYGTITLGDAANFHATFTDWVPHDEIDLLNLVASSATVEGETLTLYNGDSAVIANLQFAEPIERSDFALRQDGHGNTVITYHT